MTKNAVIIEEEDLVMLVALSMASGAQELFTEDQQDAALLRSNDLLESYGVEGDDLTAFNEAVGVELDILRRTL